MSDMTRGEMIRRLDAVCKTIQTVLNNGPATETERQRLGDTLASLLPIIADSLQDQEDRNAAGTISHYGRRSDDVRA